MSETIESKDKCVCTHKHNALPMHLIDLGLSSHTCRCGRIWRPNLNLSAFVHSGELDPRFARYNKVIVK